MKDRPAVELVDLSCFGRPARLVWHKRRWACGAAPCRVGSFTEQAPEIAPARGAMTDRAGRWVSEQVGRAGRTVAEVARELGCDWHTLNDAVIAYGMPLVEDPARIGPLSALGLDETLFCRRGRWHTQEWCTSIVDVSPGQVQLLDVVQGRDAGGPTRGLKHPTRRVAGRDRLRGVGSLRSFPQDLRRGPARGRPGADPFHLIRLANPQRLDECRRRVQSEVIGHRGRKDDPLYRARRLLTKAHERLDERGDTELTGLLRAGDPHGADLGDDSLARLEAPIGTTPGT